MEVLFLYSSFSVFVILLCCSCLLLHVQKWNLRSIFPSVKANSANAKGNVLCYQGFFMEAILLSSIFRNSSFTQQLIRLIYETERDLFLYYCT